MEIKTVLLENIRAERRLTRETVRAMTDGEMGFRPTPEQMEFGSQALHILSAYATLMEALSSDKGWNWDQAMNLSRYPTREAILKLCDQETDRLTTFVGGLERDRLLETIQTAWGTKETVLQLLVSFFTHEAHHRGQMVVYLRLKGMQPVAW